MCCVHSSECRALFREGVSVGVNVSVPKKLFMLDGGFGLAPVVILPELLLCFIWNETKQL